MFNIAQLLQNQLNINSFEKKEDESRKCACKCGYNPDSDDYDWKYFKKCLINVALKNHLTFPSFEFLSDYDEPSTVYHDYDDPSGIIAPLRHWVFLMEIDEEISLIRPGFLGWSQFGEYLPVHFYHEKEVKPTTFSWPDIKSGHTLAILYAEKKSFLDGTQGIRQENLDSCFVFKAPLQMVQDEASKLLNSADFNFKGQVQECFGCGVRKENISRCGNCKLACYCSKECQADSWKSVHKKLCSQSETLLRLASIPRSGKFKEFFTFKKSSEDYLPPYLYVKKFAKRTFAQKQNVPKQETKQQEENKI